MRQEGDTTIIPVFEEVVVVEKRLKLVEEVRLTKRQTIRHEPQTITLRRQEAVVERLPGPETDPQST
ncbi:MAG: YsnF/AvaK domain-containing protein [Rhodospirillales bacterium]|nr:YsnF/AvaK domain-containing protein [Rhodospirillales bacterium]